MGGLVGALFGGLHCLAWHFHFPTEQEAILWRVCAMYCTIAPAVIVAIILPNKGVYGHTSDIVMGAGIVLVMIGYVICRFILLGVTLFSLRGLPGGTFEATAWTKYIPHIS